VPYAAAGPARIDAFAKPRAGERHQFRLIVSPEDAAELDLTAYVRRFMARVERDLGRPLEWLAVNHYNTDHPPAHLVIRGVDRAGRELRLDRGYVANGLRGCAQALATEELGPRLDREIERTPAKEVTQQRFTSLDRELERRAVKGRVEVPSGRGADRRGHTAGASGASGRVAPGRARVGCRVVASRGMAEGARVVVGRVRRKGLADELKGPWFAIVETPTGHGYHVPLDPRSAEALRPGDVVSLLTVPERAIRAVDRRIAEGPRAHGGVNALEEDAWWICSSGSKTK
jgi:type IV secretory pathway VirD2 relaxase